MSRKQLALLLLLNFGPFAVGTSVLSLIPIYTRQMGAGSTATGFYLATAFVALALGTLSSGWLSDRFQRQKYIIALGAAISAPATFMMGQVGTLVLLAASTAVVWFMAGVQVSMVIILVGKHAGKTQRGRAFGIVGMGNALAQLVGGLAAGPLVDLWGFSALFLANTILFVVLVIVALLLEDHPVVSENSAVRTTTSAPVVMASAAFLLVAAAWGLANVANFVSVIGKPLAMHDLNFSSTAITSTYAISGAVNLPLPFVMGWFSDRFGRRPALMLAYLSGAVGLGILTQASQLWHFWLAQTFITAIATANPVGSALITDIVPAKALSASLARYSSARWVGGVVGNMSTGVAIQMLGLSLTFTIGAMLPLVAMLLVLSIGLPHPVRLPHPPISDIRGLFRKNGSVKAVHC